MNRKVFLVVLLCVAGGALAAYSWNTRIAAENQFAQEVQVALRHAEEIRRTTVSFAESAFPARVAFHQLLIRSGLDARLAFRVVHAAQQVFDMRQIRAGNRFAIGRSLDGEFRAVRYQIDLERTLKISSAGAPDEFRAEINTVPAATELVKVTGEISSSLFQGVVDAGETP